MKRIRRVAIVLRMSGSAGRDILSGIFHFTRMHPNWCIRLFQMPSEFTPDAFLSELEDGLDGIVMSESGPDETAQILRETAVPISFIGDAGPILSDRKQGMVYVRNDDELIGRMGARYLVSLGSHRAYCFVPTCSHQYWSESRQNGFTMELKARGIDPVIFRSPGTAGSREDLAALREWITKLPKPAAMMTAWDTRATQVLNLCQEVKINVPRQISIIGVDNDELLDESCIPPLTSILPDHEKLGYVAARELERLMSLRRTRLKVPFLARPLKIVERESAVTSTPTSHLIARGLNFIKKNATKGIKVDDVAKAIGVSRRLADLRFQQFNGETINEEIVRRKLDAVKKMLATTDRPIRLVSIACGYNDLAYLKTLFKRRFGVTMRDWRKMNQD